MSSPVSQDPGRATRTTKTIPPRIFWHHAVGAHVQVLREVVFDAAVDMGITNGAPHKRILFGITYAIANLYPSR